MKFGRLPHPERALATLDVSLPPVDAAGWSSTAVSAPRVWVGCPVWTARSWRGGFLPAGVSGPEMLGEYAKRLTAVELNGSFYAAIGPERLAHWRAQVPDGFRFCPKVPQQVSQGLALGRTNRRALQTFFAAVGALGGNLGPAMLQLPPAFGPEHLVALEALLDALPEPRRAIVVEFRHPGFFLCGRLLPRAAALLRNHGLGVVICDTLGRRDACHQTLTSDTVVVRMAGQAPHPSDRTRVTGWVERIADFAARGLRDVTVFIHQPEERGGPALCRVLSQQLNQRLGLVLPLWAPPEQLTLF